MSLPASQLHAVRPPGSGAELEASSLVESALREAGLVPRRTTAPAARPATVVPLAAAVLRLIAAILVLSDMRPASVAVAVAAAWLAVPGPPIVRSRLLSRLPGLGCSVPVVSAFVRGAGGERRPPGLVVVARLDDVPAKLRSGRLPAVVSWTQVALALVVAALAASTQSDRLRVAMTVVVVEALFSIGWLLASHSRGAARPIDASALQALVAAAGRMSGSSPERDVWLVAAGGGTAGAAGLRAFLDAEPDAARTSWVVVLDSLAGSEPLVVPERARLTAGAISPAVRAVAQAAMATGDAIDVASASALSPEAGLAVRRGMSGLTVTSRGTGDDSSARAAEIVDELSRTVL